ncbi:MAG: hypothetical protein L0G71_05800 [Yaniella sp.]|nr:hypothetical protein [Yaniella sp.]
MAPTQAATGAQRQQQWLGTAISSGFQTLKHSTAEHSAASCGRSAIIGAAQAFNSTEYLFVVFPSMTPTLPPDMPGGFKNSTAPAHSASSGTSQDNGRRSAANTDQVPSGTSQVEDEVLP